MFVVVPVLGLEVEFWHFLRRPGRQLSQILPSFAQEQFLQLLFFSFFSFFSMQKQIQKHVHTMTVKVSKCSHQTKLNGMEGGEPTWLHFLSTNRWTNAGTNVKLFLRGWYQASDQQVCRFWRSVGLLHGSNLPATQQQGGQTTHLRLPTTGFVAATACHFSSFS